MHYGKFALGGAGLVLTEMTDVAPEGRITPACAGLYGDAAQAAAARIVGFCKAWGTARVGVQLAHAGRKGSTHPPARGGRPLAAGEGAWTTIAPSAVPYDDGWPAPAEATASDIARIRDDFVAAARRAEAAGFDLIELHGGHGYLLHQFLSPLTNRRSDAWGGTPARRMRFVIEVYEAVRAVWPADRPIGIRLSATDWVEGGWTPEETVALARTLKDLGIDYVDVSSGGLHPAQKIPLAPGYQAPFAAKVRAGAGVTTMTVGLIADPRHAERLVADGQTDFIKLGRGHLYDPHWAWHAAEALGVEIAYPPKLGAAQPKLRPMLFPARG